MIILSLWLTMSILLVIRMDQHLINYWEARRLCLWLLGVVTIFFSTTNLFRLYTFFELSLIPIFLIVIGWGYQPERLRARLRLIFYTLLASLPLLALLRWKFANLRELTLTQLRRYNLKSEWAFVGIWLAFLVKTPIFLTHLWLPKAHVEAPVFGSMLLAALLLKLGTYGLLLFCNWGLETNFIFIMFSISFWRTVIVRFACSRVLDMKIMVAYSSVAHIGIVIFLICLGTLCSIQSAVIIMLAHGFSSASIFLIAHIQYGRTNTRSILLNKGLLSLTPGLTLAWFVVIIINLAAPPTINLVGEIIITISIVTRLSILSWGVLIRILAGSVYSLILYSTLNQPCSNLTMTRKLFNPLELLNVISYVVPGLFILLSVNSWT